MNMALAARYVPVGVAVAGASLIAITPVAPLLPDIQVRAVELSAASEGILDYAQGIVGGLENALSGASGASDSIGDLLNPFAGLFNLADPTPYTLIGPAQLFTDTVASLQGLAQQFLAAPFPILTQILANQAASFTAIGAAAEESFQNLVSYVTTELPGNLQSVWMDFSSGDIQDGLFNLVIDYLFLDPVLQLFPLISALETAVETPFANLSAAVSTGLGDSLLPILGLIEPVASVVWAIGGIGNNLVNAVDTGSFAAILQNFALAPTTLADAFLNGVPSDSLFGLLSAQDGPLGALLGLAEDIAQAITPAASSAAAVDPGTMLTDITSVLNPSTELSDLSQIFDGGSLSTLLDPANITSLLPIDLVPNLVADFSSAF
jgi:hypothetical protein